MFSSRRDREIPPCLLYCLPIFLLQNWLFAKLLVTCAKILLMMDNQAVIQRIKFLISELRLRQNSFANRIGTDVSNLSKHLNGRLPISDSLVNKIVVNLGISKDWLVNGTGVPFSKAMAPSTVVADGMTESDGGTPVYDIDVTAGSASREMIFADDRIIGHINVPGISLDSRIVRVSGDSMQPVINSGDYIAVREIRDLSVIYWGQIYVVVLDDYRMVKYLSKHLDCDKVILRSENPMYDDMELPRSAIRKLFFVDNIIHIDTRM